MYIDIYIHTNMYIYISLSTYTHCTSLLGIYLIIYLTSFMIYLTNCIQHKVCWYLVRVLRLVGMWKQWAVCAWPSWGDALQHMQYIILSLPVCNHLSTSLFILQNPHTNKMHIFFWWITATLWTSLPSHFFFLTLHPSHINIYAHNTHTQS